MDSDENAEVHRVESIIKKFGKYFLLLTFGIVVLLTMVCVLVLTLYCLGGCFDGTIVDWLETCLILLKFTFGIILYLLTELFLFILLSKLWLLM